MNHLISFINNEKQNNEKKIHSIEQQIQKYNQDIQKIEKKVIEYTKNIDTTYEIFSPNSFDRDYNVVEINKLNIQKQQLFIEIDALTEQKEILAKRQDELELALEEIFETNHRISEMEENEKIAVERAYSDAAIQFSQTMTAILEQQIEKNHHQFSGMVDEQIEILKQKIRKCQEFYEVDVNRAQVELLKLGNDIEELKYLLNSQMFHVKHLAKEDQSIYEEIQKFTDTYQTNRDIKVEFQYSGRKIKDSYYNVVNILRIMEEAVENSIQHSGCNYILLNVNVEHFVSNQNEDITPNHEDLHQINFIIEKPTDKYIVTIQIIDNGNGFAYEEKTEQSSGHMGIKLMRQRTEYLSGHMNIESNTSFGTTVTIVYEIEK